MIHKLSLDSLRCLALRPYDDLSNAQKSKAEFACMLERHAAQQLLRKNSREADALLRTADRYWTLSLGNEVAGAPHVAR